MMYSYSPTPSQGSGKFRDVGHGGHGDGEDPRLYRSIMTFLVTIYQHFQSKTQSSLELTFVF